MNYKRVKLNTILLFVILATQSAIFAGNPQSQITLSHDSLPGFRQVYIHTFSDVQFYYVTGENVAGDVVIETQYPIKVSLHCYEDFVSSLTLTADGLLNERIYVRAFPESTGNFDPIISHTFDGNITELPTWLVATESQVPETYYSTATASGSRLKTQLHHIIKGHSVHPYSSLWSSFTQTDATFAGKVWDIYSDIPCEEPPYIYTFSEDQDTGSGGGSEGDVYNREHSMPRSWFGGSVDPMNTDLYHIYPTDKYVNAQRANLPYGMVGNPYWVSMNGSKLGTNTAGDTYSGTTFEPIDTYKGDLARTFFYMITRYEDRIEDWTYSEEGNNMFDHNTYPGYQPWVIDMLIDWHHNDPVSQRERMRNDMVYQIQGNRNPFVDQPEFVEMIWGDTTLQAVNLNKIRRFHIYPNPASEQFHFISDEIILQLEIFSMEGKAILRKERIGQTGSINVSHLSPGIFIVRFRTPTFYGSQLIQIQHP
jgi:endonuclease I